MYFPLVNSPRVLIKDFFLCQTSHSYFLANSLFFFLIVTDLNLTVLFNIAQFFSNGKFKITMCLSSAKTSKEVEHNTE